MRKWIIGAAAISFLVVVSGCADQTTQSTFDETLSEEEAGFTWRKERSQDFGDYDYIVKDEAEAVEDLTDKFQLEKPPLFDDWRDLIKTEMKVDSAVQEPEEFTFNASGRELRFISKIKFKNGENYSSYGTVTARFQYLEELEQTILYSQRLDIYNSVAENTFNGKNLDAVLKKIGELLKLENLDELLETFKEATKEQEDLKGQKMIIYETPQEDETLLFGKIFGVNYDENGVLYQIYAATIDYRK